MYPLAGIRRQNSGKQNISSLHDSDASMLRVRRRVSVAVAASSAQSSHGIGREIGPAEMRLQIVRPIKTARPAVSGFAKTMLRVSGPERNSVFPIAQQTEDAIEAMVAGTA